MSDVGLWGFAGAILTPLVVLIVNIVSRSDIQRKVEVCDLKLKQLDVIRRILDIGNSFPEKERQLFDYTDLDRHLKKIAESISDLIARSETQPKTFFSEYERKPVIWRLFVVPKHSSRKGKVYEWVYYWLLLFTIVALFTSIVDFINNNRAMVFDRVNLLAIILQITMLLVFRKMAINGAKAEAVMV
jgi:hypothetical protein